MSKEWVWKVLVCGGRDYANRSAVFAELNALSPVRIIQGGAAGADRLAMEWAALNEVACLTVPAQWKKYGRRAGPIRNRHMLHEKPNLVLAFPGGRGTRNMLWLARNEGLAVRVVKDAEYEDGKD